MMIFQGFFVHRALQNMTQKTYLTIVSRKRRATGHGRPKPSAYFGPIFELGGPNLDRAPDFNRSLS